MVAGRVIEPTGFAMPTVAMHEPITAAIQAADER
jgi:hypothetical protein